MSDSVTKARKRIYQGVYLDLREDIESDNAIARVADRAAQGVDAETIALYRKYNMLDKLPKRLQLSPQDGTWGTYRAKRAQPEAAGDDLSREKHARDRALRMEWEKRLANYR